MTVVTFMYKLLLKLDDSQQSTQQASYFVLAMKSRPSWDTSLACLVTWIKTGIGRLDKSQDE